MTHARSGRRWVRRIALVSAVRSSSTSLLQSSLTYGRELGADWVVMGKISKTSDLIWIFSGELIDVASGNAVHLINLGGSPWGIAVAAACLRERGVFGRARADFKEKP